MSPHQQADRNRMDLVMFIDGLLPAARKRLVTLVDNAQVIEAAKLLGDAGTDILVVCGSDGLLAGVITKTDVVGQISQCQGCSCTTAVSSVMTQDVVVCRLGDRVDAAWSSMKDRGLKNIPITDHESRPVGVLNARDALQALLQEVENEESFLRDYVMTVGYH